MAAASWSGPRRRRHRPLRASIRACAGPSHALRGRRRRCSAARSVSGAHCAEQLRPSGTRPCRRASARRAGAPPRGASRAAAARAPCVLQQRVVLGQVGEAQQRRARSGARRGTRPGRGSRGRGARSRSRRRSRAIAFRRALRGRPTAARCRAARRRSPRAPRPTRPRSWCSCDEAEALGVLDHHQRRVRHVDADLDHRRRDQHRHLPAGEERHHRRLLGRRHAAVQQADHRGPGSASHSWRCVSVAFCRSSVSDSSISGQTQYDLPACADLVADARDHLVAPRCRRRAW